MLGLRWARNWGGGGAGYARSRSEELSSYDVRGGEIRGKILNMSQAR